MPSSSLLDMRLGSQMMPPLAPPKGTLTTAGFQVIHAARAFTSSRVTLGWERMPPFPGPRGIVCCSLQNATFKLHPALFGAKVLSFAVGGCWERQLLRHVHSADGITDQPLSANTWFVGGGVVGVARRSLVCCTSQCPAQKLHRPGQDQDPKQKSKDTC